MKKRAMTWHDPEMTAVSSQNSALYITWTALLQSASPTPIRVVVFDEP